MEVDDHLSLQQAHEMANQIEQDLRSDQPRIARINTHLESRGTWIGDDDDVTAREGLLVETIRKITDEIAGDLSCHEVTVRRRGLKYHVALHCTFDEGLSIVQVHEISSRIEERLEIDARPGTGPGPCRAVRAFRVIKEKLKEELR